jgi:hypothetical protein
VRKRRAQAEPQFPLARAQVVKEVPGADIAAEPAIKLSGSRLELIEILSLEAELDDMTARPDSGLLEGEAEDDHGGQGLGCDGD